MSAPSIEKTLTPKETFIYKDLIGPNFNPNWHFHPEFQISYIMEGEGTRFIGDHVQNFKKGDLVMTGPNLPHLWRNDDIYFEKDSGLTTRGLVIYFDHVLLSEPLLEMEEFYKINKLVEHSLRGIEFLGETRDIIIRLILELDKQKGFKRILHLLKILDTLSNSTEYNILASPNYMNGFRGGDAEKMRKVYDYVMANFKTNISLDEAAGLLNMTTTSFCRYFKPRANKTFTRFVNEIRIGHARKLLLEDNFNISQISYECGYNALSNFNRQFKSITDMSPLEYRKLFLNIQAPM
ncbi:AraC family transcriptional regulator [Zobellia galactanivorans]|uniref:AraC family transcriptional regulator n=1 Tax=Zobellia galactanivorans (strain DSM 12802 / CCUG 47099 / CIP 106680 / NCIMB 13871 / Dsij) TaxID=63186 RepID=UPI0026E387DB|nr:AraC family transcriptional regulator [Zobellia galactanivorans]MDO6811104.1 AraC family transcriptional regulator [Zobellia galactanivorans]